MNYLSELKRRNIFRVAVAYLALAWVMLQIADVVVPALGLPEMIMTAMVVIGVIGFPFALFFAWAFELTPEGIKPTKDVDVDESIRATTGQKINYIIIGLMAIAIIVLLYDRNTDPDEEQLVEAPAITELENTIAVMPFADMSADGSQEYFGDGIAEEILNVLVSVEDLKVTSRTSSFAYKGSNAQIPDIAAELGVNYVLEGSIRTAGDTVRVTAQLIDVSADQHLWSDTFDRNLSDIFAIQDEISLAISDALQVELLGDQIGDIPTTNMEAYELYLQARQLLYVPDGQRVRKALENMKQAVELDPLYAEGWAELANVYGLAELWLDATPGAGQHYVVLAIEAAEKALELDNTLSVAWAQLATLGAYAKNWEDALRAHRQLVALGPNDYNNWFDLGIFYTAVGWFDEAEEALEKAVELDPLDAVNFSVLGRAYLSNGKPEQARTTLNKSIDLGYAPASINMAIINLMEGDQEAAKRNISQLDVPSSLSMSERLGMDVKEYYDLMVEGYFNPELRDEYIKLVPKEEPSYLVTGSMLLHNSEHLTSWAEMEGSALGALLITYNLAPPFRGMINQSAMKSAVINTGLPQFWQKTKWPKFCRPVGDDDFECQDVEGNWP